MDNYILLLNPENTLKLVLSKIKYVSAFYAL